MGLDRLQDTLIKNDIKYKRKALINEYTTFKIGGCAEFIIFPDTVEKLITTVNAVKQSGIRYYILGNGSNVLISDNDLNMAFILTKELNKMYLEGNQIVCQAGASMASLAVFAKDNSLSGLEFAHGIPGSVGGGVFMNAGAYGGEISQVCVKTKYVDEDGILKEINKEEHDFSYRHSFFSKSKKVIVESVFELEKKDKNEIELKMDDLMERRKSKQPLNYPSGGSTFKRPKDTYAAKVIEDCGLKGFSIGGACVSEKHSGFIINKDNATFEDVINLINHVKSVVSDKYDITLESEIVIIE